MQHVEGRQDYVRVDGADVIEIVNWSDHQHFKDRDPIWIKLYRRLLRDRGWRMLSGGASKLLVDLWLLAAEKEPYGTIDDDIAGIAWEVRSDEAEIEEWLQELTAQGFIKTISDRYQDDALEKRRDREETEKRTTAAGPPAVGEPEEVVYTDAELLEEANAVLGLGVLGGTDLMANKRILSTWLYGTDSRKRDDIYAAIHGCSLMREADMIGWPSAKPGSPMTLKALVNAETIAYRGDGTVKQTLWFAAIDYFREGLTTESPRKTGMRSLSDVMGAA